MGFTSDLRFSEACKPLRINKTVRQDIKNFLYPCIIVGAAFPQTEEPKPVRKIRILLGQNFGGSFKGYLNVTS
jgi:hypothetical protein